MDSRFAELADRYSQSESDQEPSKCLNRFDIECKFNYDDFDWNVGVDRPESPVSLITGAHDYNWSKVYEKADSTVYFVEKNLIKEYIDSQHADEGDIKIQQTIQNTALSGDTCW